MGPFSLAVSDQFGMGMQNRQTRSRLDSDQRRALSWSTRYAGVDRWPARSPSAGLDDRKASRKAAGGPVGLLVVSVSRVRSASDLSPSWPFSLFARDGVDFCMRIMPKAGINHALALVTGEGVLELTSNVMLVVPVIIRACLVTRSPCCGTPSRRLEGRRTTWP